MHTVYSFYYCNTMRFNRFSSIEPNNYSWMHRHVLGWNSKRREKHKQICFYCYLLIFFCFFTFRCRFFIDVILCIRFRYAHNPLNTATCFKFQTNHSETVSVFSSLLETKNGFTDKFFRKSLSLSMSSFDFCQLCIRIGIFPFDYSRRAERSRAEQHCRRKIPLKESFLLFH